MNLKTLLAKINYELIQGDLNKQISSIASHHEETIKDCLYVAISGYKHDGHEYIKEVIKRQATVLVVENNLSFTIDPSITVIKVKNSRKALALISNVFFNKPSEKIKMIGITGTNGKTSISYFLEGIFSSANISTGMIGTNGIFINGKTLNIDRSTVTTPDIIDLQWILQKMNNKNVDSCIMEVSSHALHLHRVSGVNYHTSIFTNLSQEHLELHNDFEHYFKTKAKLFDLTTQNNIINIDDPYGIRLAKMCEKRKTRTITVGINNKADIMATNIRYTLKGTTYTLITPTYKMEIAINLPGEVNVYNSLLAISAAYVNGIPKEYIYNGISSVERIPGRFDIVFEKNDYKVIIDFAHTEDALKNLLKTIKPFVHGKLILVFGVYADLSEQGMEKRFSMGGIAGKFADLSVVTLDNPKYFDQNIIVKQIAEGIKSENGLYKTILDREQAIQYAIEQSNSNDIVVIAGKGHERSQIINGEEIYLNEEEVVLSALKKLAIK